MDNKRKVARMVYEAIEDAIADIASTDEELEQAIFGALCRAEVELDV